MAVFILSLAVISVSGLGLALGLIFGRGPVKGSCGGLSCGKSFACAGCTRHGEGETRS